MQSPTASEARSIAADPILEQRIAEPKGVLRRNLKMQLYLGVAVLFIVATTLSSLHRKPAPSRSAAEQPPQPALEDNSEANIAELKRTLAEPQQPASAAVGADTRQQQLPTESTADAASLNHCDRGQPCPTSAAGYGYDPPAQLTPAQQQAIQLAEQERELIYKARFASNLAYSQSHAMGSSAALNQDSSSLIAQPEARAASGDAQTSMLQVAPHLTRRPQPPPEKPEKNAPVEVNVNSAVGQPYVIYEGTTVNAVLMNRLDGDAEGPVKVLVTDPVYSHDHQHVLIPEGTVALGEARKIGDTGFGQQRRMAIAFHRMIMPDGYSVDLDQFQGLDQFGSSGMKDKVNNHYLQIFGTSIALGMIGAAAELTNNASQLTANGAEVFKYGAAASISQSGMNILDRFMNIPPTITIREGHRMKVYISQDLLLPAVENHTIAQTL